MTGISLRCCKHTDISIHYTVCLVYTEDCAVNHLIIRITATAPPINLPPLVAADVVHPQRFELEGASFLL